MAHEATCKTCPYFYEFTDEEAATVRRTVTREADGQCRISRRLSDV